MRRPIIIVAVAAVAAVLAGCAATFGGDRVDERFVRPEHPRTSPSGQFVARVEFGPEQNGVPTWIVLITGRAGHEVFRDSQAYSSRHGVGITWQHGKDELWLISSDVGTSSVRRDPDGTWHKEYPRPGHFDEDVPAEIRELAGR
ncbi:MAG TPA: hypothetical protein VHH34_19635 [Pseudonocardiaceae bacterium]|nr:hypothetical protein [Pseudonocardiaceae bacterium]